MNSTHMYRCVHVHTYTHTHTNTHTHKLHRFVMMIPLGADDNYKAIVLFVTLKCTRCQLERKQRDKSELIN